MHRISAVAATLGGLVLLGFLATPANAVPDPVATVTCVVEGVTDLVDPASIAVPSELPGGSCLAP
ncbi:hypothetical protein M1P56_18680 [Streptomyces sp. HU2014]|uniref:hypothetical protein n=1 Tax=Streptomyces sp. HU2014 TaxID=2939414 RepID=UPI00200C16E5|nr:hypothetical protein [Streptomyces sp. HU2014]UQI46219.1 hypothetical protein M1P56_18680 [Streptomyces sp. HU2014]